MFVTEMTTEALAEVCELTREVNNRFVTELTTETLAEVCHRPEHRNLAEDCHGTEH